MKSVSFCTLGCKVNQYETEAMITLFKNKGYEIKTFDEVCDIFHKLGGVSLRQEGHKVIITAN